MGDAVTGYPPPLRIGIVGTGGISRTHGRRARDLGATVAAVCGRRLASAQALAAELGGAATHDDLSEMLRTERLDVLHVCTPHALHAEQALAGLAAGCNVVCEKPLATSLDDANRLVEAAVSAGLVGACCFSKRTYPMVAELRARTLAGELGELRAVRGGYLSWDFLDDRLSWNFDPAVAGPLYATADLGVHWLDLVEHVTDRRTVELEARFSTQQRQRRPPGGEPVDVGTEDYVRIWLELEGGAVGSGIFSGVTPGRPNGLEISVDGADAGLDWCEESAGELQHRPGRDPVRTILRNPDRMSPSARALAMAPAGHLEGFPDAFRNLFEAVYRAAAGQPHLPFPTFADGARGVALVDAVGRSAAARAPVEPHR